MTSKIASGARSRAERGGEGGSPAPPGGGNPKIFGSELRLLSSPSWTVSVLLTIPLFMGILDQFIWCRSCRRPHPAAIVLLVAFFPLFPLMLRVVYSGKMIEHMPVPEEEDMV